MENIFFFYGSTEFMLFLVLAWRYGFFYLSKILSAFFTRSLGMGLASSHDDLIFKTDFLIPYFRLRGLAYHLASTFFLPLSGDTEYRQPDPHFFPSFNGRPELTYILYLLLTVNLWLIQTRWNSSNSLFLFSQWDTTWQMYDVGCRESNDP